MARGLKPELPTLVPKSLCDLATSLTSYFLPFLSGVLGLKQAEVLLWPCHLHFYPLSQEYPSPKHSHIWLILVSFFPFQLLASPLQRCLTVHKVIPQLFSLITLFSFIA